MMTEVLSAVESVLHLKSMNDSTLCITSAGLFVNPVTTLSLFAIPTAFIKL